MMDVELKTLAPAAACVPDAQPDSAEDVRRRLHDVDTRVHAVQRRRGTVSHRLTRADNCLCTSSHDFLLQRSLSTTSFRTTVMSYR